MASLNKICIIGYLSIDPDLKFSKNDSAICTFRVGVNEKRKISNVFESCTEWFHVVCFGRLAENSKKYLNKGSQVYISGRLQTSSYENKLGEFKVKLEIISNSIVFLNGRGNKVNKSTIENFGKNKQKIKNSKEELYDSSLTNLVSEDCDSEDILDKEIVKKFSRRDKKKKINTNDKNEISF